MNMEVCAVFDVEQDLWFNEDGSVLIPRERLIGYAVFEYSQIISPIMASYAEAANWMEQELERHIEASSEPSLEI
jgi:hypothetical protein